MRKDAPDIAAWERAKNLGGCRRVKHLAKLAQPVGIVFLQQDLQIGKQKLAVHGGAHLELAAALHDTPPRCIIGCIATDNEAALHPFSQPACGVSQS